VSCPTQHSGVVTNTGIGGDEDGDEDDEMKKNKSDNNDHDGAANTFRLTLRDGRSINLKTIRPAVLVSDASTNILKTLARANASLEDISTTVGLLPELLTAIALLFNKSVTEAVSEMASNASRSASTTCRVDPKTGDITVGGGRLPLLSTKNRTATAADTVSSGRGPAPWEDMTKIRVQNILKQLISNPLSHVMVQGNPIDDTGIKTVERKMKMDIINKTTDHNSSSLPFLNLVGDNDSRRVDANENNNNNNNINDDDDNDNNKKNNNTENVSTTISQFKESWREIGRLQDIIIKKAIALKEELAKNNIATPSSYLSSSPSEDIDYRKIEAISVVLQSIKRAQNVIKDEMINYFVTNDIVSSVESTATKYKDENVGFLGMIDEADEFDISDYKIENILNIVRPFKSNLLSTSEGKTNQEHDIVIGSGDSLMTPSLANRIVQQKNNDNANGLSSTPQSLYEAFLNNPTVREAIMDKLYPSHRINDNGQCSPNRYNRIVAENILIDNEQIFQTAINVLNASSEKYMDTTTNHTVTTNSNIATTNNYNNININNNINHTSLIGFNQLYTKNII